MSAKIAIVQIKTPLYFKLTINNVKYKKRIVGGEMLHLALVKNPRYNGTEIWMAIL